jgi:methyl-accepting chemotaxis protein
MLARQTIGARLGIAFGSIVLLLIAATAVGLYGLSALRDSAHELKRNATLTHASTQVQRLALEARRFEKDVFINLGDAQKLQSYKSRWDANRQSLADLLQQGATQGEDDRLHALYRTASQSLETYANGFAAVYGRIGRGEFADTAAANRTMGEFKDAIYRLDEAAGAIDQVARENLEQANRQVDDRFRHALTGLLGFAALALLLAVPLALYITRSIGDPLRRALAATRRVADGDLTQALAGNGSDETSQLLDAMGETNRKLSSLVTSLHEGSASVFRGAHEVLVGSQDLAVRTDEQVAALHQTSTSLEQITASARQTSDATEQASQLAISAARTAQSGGENVERSIQLMRELSTSSRQIDDIIGVIDSIAFQTNILALNASVEAARAGEHGRGFAVVAAEVRTLANRSAASAHEIRTLIEAIGRKIADGAQQAVHSGETIHDTVSAIDQLASLMQQIAGASREQRGGFGQIESAIIQLENATRQNAALVEQSRAAAADLEGQAAHMQSLVASFKTHDTPADGHASSHGTGRCEVAA